MLPPTPLPSNPLNEAHARSTPIHTDSRTYSNPLFHAQDIKVENVLFHSQNYLPPNSLSHTQKNTQIKIDAIKGITPILEDFAPALAQGATSTQVLSTPFTQALSLNLTQTPQTRDGRSRVYLEYHT
eukprot:1155997-Pelagomonas_calceolata.AAC.1